MGTIEPTSIDMTARGDSLLQTLRVRSRGDDQVMVGSVWMLASTLSVSTGSFLFWLIAARMADADLVGRAAGLFSVVFFLTYATSLGLPIAVARFAATPDPVQARRFHLAVAATAYGSIVGSMIFALAEPRDLLDPVNQWGAVIGWLVLCVLSVGVSISVIVDVRLMGHRRWDAVFVRSTAIALIRLPLLVWAVRDDSGFWVFVIAAGGYAVTALPYLPGLLRGAAPGPVRWLEHVEALRFAGVNYASDLAVQAPLFVTPVVVALEVGDDENATFYLSWGIMTVVYLGIHLLGRTLLVEGSRAGADVARQARTTLKLGLAVAVPAAVLAIPAAPIAELIYGSEHDDMSTLLPLLMAGTVPWVFTRTSLAIARARADTRQTLTVALWSAGTMLVCVATGGAIGDSVTAAMGWVVGSVLALLVSLPMLRHQLRLVSGPARR